MACDDIRMPEDNGYIMFDSLWLQILRADAHFVLPIPEVADDTEMPHVACASLLTCLVTSKFPCHRRAVS